MSLRLFLAFEVPAEAVPTGASEAVPGARPIQEPHMTLVFLGAQEAAEPVVEAVSRVLDGGAPGRPTLAPLVARRLLALPRRRPRVLAVEYSDDSGACTALQGALAAALAEAGLVEPERRRWLPHVSVARLSREAAPPRPPDLPEISKVSWTPERVELVRSHLGGGRPARYEALRAWPVGRGTRADGAG